MFGQSHGLGGTGVLSFGGRMKTWTFNKCTRYRIQHAIPSDEGGNGGCRSCGVAERREEVTPDSTPGLPGWRAVTCFLWASRNAPLTSRGRASPCSEKGSGLATKCPDWSGQPLFKIHFIIFQERSFVNYGTKREYSFGSCVRIFSTNSVISQKNTSPRSHT